MGWKPLFSFIKNRVAKGEGLTCISLSDAGIAVATVERPSSNKPVLKACTFRPCNSPASLRTTLRSTVAQLHLARTPCSYILQPGEYELLLMDALQVEADELKYAMQWQIKDLIEYPSEEAAIDAFSIPAYGPGGQRKMMYTVAARASQLQQKLELLRSCGLKPTIIDIPELALRNITALFKEEDEQGASLLRLQPNGGMIIIAKQKSLYLARNIDLNNLCTEVTRSFDYYHTQLGQTPPTKLLLAPTQTSEIHRTLSEELSINVEILDIRSKLECQPAFDAQQQMQCLLAIGGALRTEEQDQHATN